jgi:hypothetical protein
VSICRADPSTDPRALTITSSTIDRGDEGDAAAA